MKGEWKAPLTFKGLVLFAPAAFARSDARRTPLTEPLITIPPECSVDEAMRLITTNRVRHLPIVCDGVVHGLISIGDLVQWIAFAQDQTIEVLEHYIEGKYPC